MKSAASSLSIEQELREMNEALLISSVHQHELVEQAQAAEAALRDSEQRFRTLFELGPVAVYSCDASGVIREFNRRAAELWGRTPTLGDTDERFCGSFRMIRPDGSVLAHEHCPMAEVLSGKVPHVRDAEVRIDRPDGSQITVVVNIRPLKNEQGEITGAINCFHDITERKQGEKQLERAKHEADEANHAKDLFLATLSHEMRTPLSAIVGWMSLLEGGTEGGCTDAELNEGLDVVKRNARAMVELLDDVMDVSRIVSGKLRLEVRPNELSAIIGAGIEVVRTAAEAKGIAISVDLDPMASGSTCDAARMQQVIWNLLSNAIKFTPKGGKIRVSLARDQTNARVQISDSGPGISRELLPYVFDRFRQADSSTRRKFGGLGLGLSIVKQLVELHGGTVEADSPGEGLGSTFTVNLPIRAVSIKEGGDGLENEDGQPTSRAVIPSVRLDGLRVLIVDDEPDARRLLTMVLQQAGAVVTEASSAADAVAALPTVNPEILISDLGMPDADGFDLISEIRAQGYHARDLPAVALSAFIRKEDQRQALLAGFQVHLSKPVDPRDLTAAIASLAGRT